MNIIQKLNSITIEDLKKLDKEQVKEAVTSHPEIVINILLIAITLYATIFIYHSDKKRAKELKQEMIELKEKSKVVKRSHTLRDEYNAFINNFPQRINIDALSNQLSDLAVKNNVQILFFTPGGKTGNDFIETVNIKLRISAYDYANIIGFIKDIEESPFNVSIERWYGEAVRQAPSVQSSKAFRIQIEANIELILYTLIDP
jgi:Tfp pilus assembly protein PilO